MLKLRRGIVTREVPLMVRSRGEERRAWADEGLVGEVRTGDEVIVNTEALDLGLGGMAALEAAHASLSLELETLIAPRMSSADPRPRHLGVSHHTATVLRRLLGEVRVPAPAGEPLDELLEPCGERHRVWPRQSPVDEYAASELPMEHMGRRLGEDRLFFAAALAAGDALAAATLAGAPA